MQNHSHPQTMFLFSDSLFVVYNKCNITSTKYTLLKINTTTSIYTFLATAFRLILRSYLKTTRARVPPGYPNTRKQLTKTLGTFDNFVISHSEDIARWQQNVNKISTYTFDNFVISHSEDIARRQRKF